MQCPACHQPLNENEIVTTDNQKAIVYECFNCGGHFVPPLIANFIPEATAMNLDSVTPKNTVPVGTGINCPVCQSTMVNIRDDSIPRGVEIYSCPENHGNFFPLRQLFAFKRAQKSKLEYHQLWGIPIKSIFAVLLPVIAIFTAISVLPLTLEQIRTRQESQIRAGGVIGTPLVTPINPTEVVISFTTNNPSLVKINLTLPDATVRTIEGSLSPQTTHVITLPNLIPATPYSYTIFVDNLTAGPFSFTTQSQ